MSKSCKYAAVGGQALIEGILMKAPERTVMALRLPDQSIEVEEKEYASAKDKYPFLKWPLLRGVAGFVESMIVGYKSLMESAEKTSFEEIKNAPQENESKIDKWISEHFGEKMVAIITGISAVIGIALSFFLFMYLPTIIANGIDHLTTASLGTWRVVIEGIIRIIIFIGYMVLVSQMKDIKRMFMYHGAEHKTIFCHEAGLELTVENVRKQSRFHPRCGTSFIFVMILISILISSLLSVIIPGIRDITPLWITAKVLLLPLIMGLGYEFIRYAGKHDNLFVKIVSAPGLAMQRITTNEPTDDIIEVGIASLLGALNGVPEKAEDSNVSNTNNPEVDELFDDDK